MIYLKIWYARVFIGCAIYTCKGVVLVLTKLLNKQWYNVTYERQNISGKYAWYLKMC